WSAERSLSTDSDSVCRRRKASRCADLGPMPGSLPNSSIRFWTGPSYTVVPVFRRSRRRSPPGGGGAAAAAPAGSHAQAPHHVAEAAAALGQGPEAGLGELLDLGVGVAERAHDEVLEGVDVCRVHDLWVDLDAGELAGAPHGDGDERAAGLRVHIGRGDLLLGLGELGVHLLGLLEEGGHIGSGLHGGSSRRGCRSVTVPTGMAVPSAVTSVTARSDTVPGRAVCPRGPGAVAVPVRLAARSMSGGRDRKSTRLNSSHVSMSYAVVCLTINSCD